MSFLGVFSNAGEVEASKSGSIWTTTGSCGTPQNVNLYKVGDEVYINGAGFTASKKYSWNITAAPTGKNDPVASGKHKTDFNGDICFSAYTVQDGDSGEYKAKFGGKKDNYRVDETCVDDDDDGVQP